jgi:hypothetical protein
MVPINFTFTASGSLPLGWMILQADSSAASRLRRIEVLCDYWLRHPAGNRLPPKITHSCRSAFSLDKTQAQDAGFTKDGLWPQIPPNLSLSALKPFRFSDATISLAPLLVIPDAGDLIGFANRLNAMAYARCKHQTDCL